MIKKIKNKKLFLLGISIALIIATADFYSKKIIFIILDNYASANNLAYPQINLTGFFALTKIWNKGISFGMFNNFDNAKYLIVAINCAIMIGLFIWLYKNKYIYLTWAIALIIGGALGNLFDRLKNDAVADFLDFHIFSYHYPAFNLADSSIFIGVVLLLLENFFLKKIK